MFESRHRVFAPALALAITAISLVGCDATQNGEASPPIPVPVANFSDVSVKLPYPFDYFFTGTADGTLNIPSAISWHPLSSSLNALDGWSTNAVIDTSFSMAIDPASVNEDSVKVIKLWVDYATKGPCQRAICLPAGVASPIAGELEYGTDFVAQVSPSVDAGGKFLQIVPLKPLDASRGLEANKGGPDEGKILNVGYVVVITNELKATDGQAFGPDALYASVKPPASCAALATKYQALCGLTQFHLGVAQSLTGVDPDDVIVSWWFSTQSVDDVLAKTTDMATPQPTLVVPTGLTTQVLNANPIYPPMGKADIYVGSTRLPYYLTRPANANDAASVMTKSWTGVGGSNLTMLNPEPKVPAGQDATLTVPLLVTIPNAASGCTIPANGWPVAIFQHGITQNRTNALPIADAYARKCIAVAAIDLPLHGIVETTSPFYCNPTKPQCLGATERTFDIDIQNNDTGAAVPDGKIDPSGGKNGLTYFNFFNPLVFRDNLRQSEVDLGNLTKSIPGLAIATPTGLIPINIDETQIHYIGHSQGAIVGGAHVHFSNDTRTATLANPGGPITLVAQASEFYGPVAEGLVGRQAIVGSYNYDMVFRDVQAVLDSGDPYNHIKNAAEMHPVLLFSVKGDATIPNVSTDALIDAAGLTKADTIGPNPVAPGAGKYSLFTVGDHGTLLNFSNQAATEEMQSQAASFADSVRQEGGPFVEVTDSSVLDLN